MNSSSSVPGVSLISGPQGGQVHKSTRLGTTHCRYDRHHMRLALRPLPRRQDHNPQLPVLKVLLISKVAIRRHQDIKTILLSCTQQIAVPQFRPAQFSRPDDLMIHKESRQRPRRVLSKRTFNGGLLAESYLGTRPRPGSRPDSDRSCKRSPLSSRQHLCWQSRGRQAHGCAGSAARRSPYPESPRRSHSPTSPRTTSAQILVPLEIAVKLEFSSRAGRVLKCRLVAGCPSMTPRLRQGWAAAETCGTNPPPSLPARGLRTISPSARILRDSRIFIATAAELCSHCHRQPPSYRKGLIPPRTATREGKKACVK